MYFCKFCGSLINDDTSNKLLTCPKCILNVNLPGRSNIELLINSIENYKYQPATVNCVTIPSINFKKAIVKSKEVAKNIVSTIKQPITTPLTTSCMKSNNISV